MPRRQAAGISAASVKAAHARLAVLLASANPLPAISMLDILNLALPFFGLIFIGFACGKCAIPDAGLAWMNFFILYVALPALFFRILSKTPFEQLAQIDFVKATVLATASAFTCVHVGLICARPPWRGDTGRGGRRLRQRRLHGPRPGAGDAGAGGLGAGCADLLLRCAADLHAGAAADGVQRASSAGLGRALLDWSRSIVLNPLLIAAALGVAPPPSHVEPPVAVERLLAVPLHVGGAVRAVRARRHGGAATAAAHAAGGAAACRP